MSALYFITYFCLHSNCPVTWHSSVVLHFGTGSALTAQSPAHTNWISNYMYRLLPSARSVQQLLVELIQVSTSSTGKSQLNPGLLPRITLSYAQFSHQTNCARKPQWTALVRLITNVTDFVKIYFLGVVWETVRSFSQFLPCSNIQGPAYHALAWSVGSFIHSVKWGTGLHWMRIP